MKPCNGRGMPMVKLNQPSNFELTILPSLDHTPTPTPGNRCNHTGNGGSGCVPGNHHVNNNEKAFAGRRSATSSPPTMVVSGAGGVKGVVPIGTPGNTTEDELIGMRVKTTVNELVRIDKMLTWMLTFLKVISPKKQIVHLGQLKKTRFEHVWRILKESEKFAPQPSYLHASKRAKTPESNTDVDLHDYEVRPRPMGQKAAKRKGKSKAKESSTSQHNTEIGKRLKNFR
ncbi:hypothetical protein OSB04_000944 [Centaurea solstitialis]|uniref:Uncharacterized protein n=1 Tax=Centaurea solstitialis TaxID=347529 RepID=A0AA38TXK4_9ASTR|nr:hypothetical protein OSB04_000944 [Centaurea solstitialis]